MVSLVIEKELGWQQLNNFIEMIDNDRCVTRSGQTAGEWRRPQSRGNLIGKRSCPTLNEKGRDREETPRRWFEAAACKIDFLTLGECEQLVHPRHNWRELVQRLHELWGTRSPTLGWDACAPVHIWESLYSSVKWRPEECQIHWRTDKHGRQWCALVETPNALSRMDFWTKSL